MGTNALESGGRQVLRKMQHLSSVFLLSCVTNPEYAAALAFNEAVPDESPPVAYRWLAGINATEAVVPGRQADDRTLVWGSYRLVADMEGRAGPDGLPRIFFEQENSAYCRSHRAAVPAGHRRSC